MTVMVNEWDPLGLIGMGCPLDEYDCVVSDVLRALERGETADDLARNLATEIAQHFGSAPSDAGPFAKKAILWYHSRWPGSHV
jgi:hypothetical protein